jgi:acyl-CoA synthetase (AMP-forming)/AMP-acid ligase II
MARPVDVDDVYVYPFPLCHVAGYNVLQRHANGRPVALLDGFDASRFCDVVEATSATSCSLAATMLASLLDLLGAEPERRGQLTTLRSIGYGASPMPTPLLRRADAMLGVDLGQGYGMTELSGNAVFLDAATHRRGLDDDESILSAAGVPAPGVEVRIVDEDGTDLADGQVGEITVRAPQVMVGYLDDPEATAAAIVDGWLRTGDLGRLDDGMLRVVDRRKDMIISGGENVASLEVEEAVMSHPTVSRVAVIGVPDAHWGENVCAVVVPVDADGFDVDAVETHVRSRLAGFKVPRHWWLVDALPVNAAGKVTKAELRRRVADDPSVVGPRR